MSSIRRKQAARKGKKQGKKQLLDMSTMGIQLGESSDPGASPHESDDDTRSISATIQAMVKDAVSTLISQIKRLEAELNKAVEYESKRISDLERKNSDLETRIKKMEKEMIQLKRHAEDQHEEIKKSERISRRNNFRIVGMAEKEGEDNQENCINIVQGILKEKFNMEDAHVDQAHRVGRKGERPRHILVKINTHGHKINIMKEARRVLGGEVNYYIIDDLSKPDLEEKRKYADDVARLFREGTKLRFYAGKWRGAGGQPFFNK